MRLGDVLNHFLVDCEIRGLAPTAIKWYQVRIGLFLEKLVEVCSVTELEQVRLVHLRQVVQVLMNTPACANNPCRPTQDKPLSAFTVRGYVRAVKRFFSWCFEEDLIDVDPAARLVQPKAPDYVIATFTTEHIERMLEVCDNGTEEGFRNYVILLVFLDTGMRLSELAGLRVVDVGDCYVKVYGKGRKEREIGMHPEVGKLLWKYIHKHRKPATSDELHVFLGKGGKPLKSSGISEIVKRIKRECRFDNIRVSPHVFRHTFAKIYLKRGGEIFKLSREMGHSSVQVTEIYLKDFQSSEARKVHTDFSPVGSLELLKRKKRRKK